MVNDPFQYRTPSADDATAVSGLIAACSPLDTNSLYCTLLQCTQFAASCIVAERDGRIVGWVSGHRPPDDPEAAFVWQVAVHPEVRGRGLGAGLLEAWLRLPAVADAQRVLATISPSNRASHGLFASFADRRGWVLDIRPCFESERHFGGAHESEELIIIGPLDDAKTAQSRKDHR